MDLPTVPYGVCETPGCGGKMKARGVCMKCYHKLWVKRQKINYRKEQVKLLEDAYQGATTWEARLRMRRYLEEFRKAAN